jgi:hypothetical protein
VISRAEGVEKISNKGVGCVYSEYYNSSFWTAKPLGTLYHRNIGSYRNHTFGSKFYTIAPLVARDHHGSSNNFHHAII